MEKSEIQALIDSLNIEYKALFVPQSQSRNAKEKHPSLNWIVTVSKNNQSLSTDYMQGIGHLPQYLNEISNNLAYSKYIKNCVETGKYKPRFKNRNDFFNSNWAFDLKPIPAPQLIDILYSLVMDSDVINYSSFEDWADNFGYEQDSRSAEKIYKQCLEIALKLRAMLGNETIQQLQEAFQDY